MPFPLQYSMDWVMDVACRRMQISAEHSIVDFYYANDIVLFADSYGKQRVSKYSWNQIG